MTKAGVAAMGLIALAWWAITQNGYPYSNLSQVRVCARVDGEVFSGILVAIYLASVMHRLWSLLFLWLRQRAQKGQLKAINVPLRMCDNQIPPQGANSSLSSGFWGQSLSFQPDVCKYQYNTNALLPRHLLRWGSWWVSCSRTLARERWHLHRFWWFWGICTCQLEVPELSCAPTQDLSFPA